jgi:hypothetical protein
VVRNANPSRVGVVMSDRNDGDEFGLASRALGGLPIVNQVLDRLGLPVLLAEALPVDDARVKLAPAVALRCPPGDERAWGVAGRDDHLVGVAEGGSD